MTEYRPLLLLGLYQTGIGMVVDATGPLGAADLARRNHQRDWLVVNTALHMAVDHCLRVLALRMIFIGVRG